MLKAIEKPRPLPVLPPLSKLDDSVSARENIKKWAALSEETQSHNDIIFEKALKRIKWCAFWNGMLERPLSEHFSWCPHDDWDQYWQASGWPPLPKV